MNYCGKGGREERMKRRKKAGKKKGKGQGHKNTKLLRIET